MAYHSVFEELADLLANMNPDKVLAFRTSKKSQFRLEQLLEKTNYFHQTTSTNSPPPPAPNYSKAPTHSTTPNHETPEYQSPYLTPFPLFSSTLESSIPQFYKTPPALANQYSGLFPSLLHG